MVRIVCPSIAIFLSQFAVTAQAAPFHKRSTTRWHGCGFLPGYVQPPSNNRSRFMVEDLPCSA
jgi:hypothetical protein